MSDSNYTKRSIADGFKNLMIRKPFEKITISDITSSCGLNRQTFYYHFQDKYELLNWVFYSEAIAPFIDNITFDNWSIKLLEMLCTLRSNSHFYANALKTSYGDEFKIYIHKIATDVFSEIIDHISGGKNMAEDDKQFIAEFFSYGIFGCVIAWITNGMKDTPERMISHIENLVNDCKKLAVKRYLEA